MLSEERLKEVLTALGLRDAKIEVGGTTGHLVAEVVSPSFAGQDDAIRQALIWKHLYDNLTEAENTEVDFVFTTTPQEHTELQKSAPSQPD
jgi:acid stress-induced BolA-like protein IbaG/YrbA